MPLKVHLQRRVNELEKQLKVARRKNELLVEALDNVECTCLPHATPGNGTMCVRCEAFASVANVKVDEAA